MTKELAKTLTTALVQFIDRERPEGSMCCSSAECERIEKAFEGGTYDVVEAIIKKKLEVPLTAFQQCLNVILRKVYFAEVSEDELNDFLIKIINSCTKDLLELAKNELLSYPDESNPAIEAMADLERTFECNPDKLPGWLKDELNKAFKKGQESSHEDYVKGYANGYKDAEKRYNESVAYHYSDFVPQRPLCWEPGGTCTNPQMDCINCPRKTTGGGFNTSSGTSTATLHGNTSVTDGKEHNPSFTD